jgi:hypothetical protein
MSIGELDMRKGNSRSRITTFVCSFIMLFFVTNNGSVEAMVNAQARASLTTSSGSWGAVLVDHLASPVNSPYVITWQKNQGSQFAIIDLINTGSTTITGQSYVFTTIDQSGSTINSPTISLDTCNKLVRNSKVCPGLENNSNIGTVSNGTLSSSFSVAPSASITLKISLSSELTSVWTTKIHLTVNRSQIQAATVTNS